MQKTNNQMSFTGVYVSRKKLKKEFFTQINKLVDRTEVEAVIRNHYNKGLSVAGRHSYPGLLIFKMCLLQTWYGLSDYEVEEKVNDSLSFMQFAGLQLQDEVPDHSVISRFRSELTRKDAFEKIFEKIITQLENKGLVIKTGAIVDATVTESPRKPRGKTTYIIAGDRTEEDRSETDIKKEAVAKQIIKMTQRGRISRQPG